MSIMRRHIYTLRSICTHTHSQFCKFHTLDSQTYLHNKDKCSYSCYTSVPLFIFAEMPEKDHSDQILQSFILQSVQMHSYHTHLSLWHIIFQNHGHCLSGYNILHSSEKAFSVSVGICVHSVKRAFVTSVTDFGQKGLAHSSHSSSSWRCSVRLRSGLCAPNLSNNVYRPFFTQLYSRAGTGNCCNNLGQI